MLATQHAKLSWRDSLARWFWLLTRAWSPSSRHMQTAVVAVDQPAASGLALLPVAAENVEYVDVGRKFPLRADFYAQAYRAADEA